MNGPVAVTGAAGFLGSTLVAQLTSDGSATRCLLRPGQHLAIPFAVGAEHGSGVEEREVSLLDESGCEQALAGSPVLYHLAARLSGSPSVIVRDTVVATRTLLTGAARAGVRRCVLVSSLAVHATSRLPAGAVVDEDTALDPEPHRRDPYTHAKVLQEQLAVELCDRHGMELVVVRPGVVFGPGRSLLSGRVGLVLGGLLVQMGGRQRLPYTYVDNCAAAVRLAGLVEAAAGRSVNVVDDDLPTAAQLVRTLKRRGAGPRRVVVPAPLIGPLIGTYEALSAWTEQQFPPVLTRYRAASTWKCLTYDNRRAKDLLGWRPEVGFDDGVDRVLAQGRP